MLKNKNFLFVIPLVLIVFLIFFIKSSKLLVENVDVPINVQCKFCFEYNKSIFSFSNDFNIIIEADGYKIEEFLLSHKNGINTISLQPKEVTLFFKFTNVPEFPDLKFDKKEIKFKQKISILPGEYVIDFNANNYFRLEKIILIKPSANEYLIDLSKNLIQKEIIFESRNYKKLILDKFKEINIGEKIIIQKTDNLVSYNDNNGIKYEYSFNVSNNDFEIINLDTVTTEKDHAILIDSFPTGAAVSIDEEYVGITPLNIPSQKITKLEIFSAGYINYIRNFNSEKLSKDIFIELKPLLSNVVIDTSPQSKIFINEKYIATTPYTIDLPTGIYDFKLVLEDYATHVERVKIEGGYDIEIKETLIKFKDFILQNSPKILSNSIGINLILMDPGKIVLGSPETEVRRLRNEIIRNVELTKHFYVSKNLISEKIYNQVMKGTGGSDLPKVNISWEDAALFVNKLSYIDGLENFYKIENGTVVGFNPESKGYRLLSESEWEVCASENYEKSIFPWGNIDIVPAFIGNLAGEENDGKLKFYIPNYQDDFEKRSPVDSFKANKNGFTDIIGNTSEWTHDFYSEDFLSSSNEIFYDYLGPSFGNSHVVKGSNYESNNQSELGTSYRVGIIEPSELISFRVARWIY